MQESNVTIDNKKNPYKTQETNVTRNSLQSARLKNDKNDNRSKEKANNARDNNGTIHNKRISNKA